ncbi:MAG: hypothetical protein KY395_00615 [Actinobacteria bacterium]|nr:hypothetical protein [Actinomycetota bacterium]
MRWLAGATTALVMMLPSCAGPGDVGELGSGTTSSDRATTSVAAPRSPGLSAPLPEALTEVAGTAWKGQMVVVGGLRADGRASSKVYIYDPGADAWSEGPSLPEALHHTTAVVGPAGRLWVIGGYGVDGRTWVPKAEVWSLGPTDRRWKSEPPLAHARGALAGTMNEETIVAIGGSTVGDGSPQSVSRVVEFLKPDSTRWERGPDLNDPREHLAAVTTGDRVLAIGGRVGGLDTNLRSVESWRPGQAAWRRESPLQKERGGFAATSVGAVPCVAGGEQTDRTISLVECLRGGKWRVVAQLSDGRHGLAAGSLAGRLHFVAGGLKPGLFVSDVHEVLDVGE